MKRIGTFKACNIYDEKDIITINLYIDNGDLGFKLRCTICRDCEGHFTKLNGLEYLGYKLADDSIIINGEIAK